MSISSPGGAVKSIQSAGLSLKWTLSRRLARGVRVYWCEYGFSINLVG